MANPITQVLLNISKPIQDEITTESGVRFYYDGSYNKNFAATVVATIAALPTNPHPKYKKILDQLKVGDEVAVSYRIVADFAFQGDGDRFMQCTEDNPHLKEFVNGKGYWIRMYALPKISGLSGHIWVGMYMDNRMNLIDGVQGDESELYRWMSQFPFGKTDIFTFNNFFEHEGMDYWRCDPDDIFAIKNKKGHLVAIGDRVICKPIENTVPDKFLVGEHKGHDVKMRYSDRGRVITGGATKGVKKDQVISFDSKHCEKYEFFGRSYYLINENLINGVWK